MTLFEVPLSVSWPAFVALAFLLVAWLMFWRDFKLTPNNTIAFLVVTGAFAKIVLDLTLWGENVEALQLHTMRFWVGVGFAALLLIISILLSAGVRIYRDQEMGNQADN